MKSRPTHPVFSRSFGAPPYGTPRSKKVDPDLPCPLDVGAPALGSPRQAPVLDTLFNIIAHQSWYFLKGMQIKRKEKKKKNSKLPK